jgi:hypothetical protein
VAGGWLLVAGITTTGAERFQRRLSRQATGDLVPGGSEQVLQERQDGGVVVSD